MGETILDDCWARGMKWRFKHNGPTPTFTNMCVKMPMCTASIMSATGITFYNDCIDKSLPSSKSTRDATEDTSSRDASNDQVYTGPIYSIPDQGERSGFLLLKATPVTFHQLRYLDQRYLDHIAADNEKTIISGLPISGFSPPDLTNPEEKNIANYIGNDSQYEDEDGDYFYHYELTEKDYIACVGESWKYYKEKDPIGVEDRLMGNKMCRLYLSTTEFPPLEPPLPPRKVYRSPWYHNRPCNRTW